MLAGGTAARLLRGCDERGWRAEVFIAKAASYDCKLGQAVRDGLHELGFGKTWVKRKRVLLKPNLVEPYQAAPHIHTHPALVGAVAAVFRSWGASEVVVAEGQGHCRDSELVLEQAGLATLLHEQHLPFVDLNHDDVVATANRSRFTSLNPLYLPRTLQSADLIVSLPKLKTHHWAGVTLAMKNLFGCLPGVCYGWPKNVLHEAGITESILDVNATIRPHLAIVDGIVGMEGDGPIMGTPRAAHVLVVGTNLAAVDATGARLMGVDPYRIGYLTAASGRLGPIAECHIEQRGESIASLAQEFSILDHPSLAGLQGSALHAAY